MFMKIYKKEPVNSAWCCSLPKCLFHPCVRFFPILDLDQAFRGPVCDPVHVSLSLQVHTNFPLGCGSWHGSALLGQTQPSPQLLSSLFSTNLALVLIPSRKDQRLSHLWAILYKGCATGKVINNVQVEMCDCKENLFYESCFEQ